MRRHDDGSRQGSLLCEAGLCLALLSYGMFSLFGLVSQNSRGTAQVDRSTWEVAQARDRLDQLESSCIRAHFQLPPQEAEEVTVDTWSHRFILKTRSYVEPVPACPGLHRLTVLVRTETAGVTAAPREISVVRLVSDPERIAAVPAPPEPEPPTGDDAEDGE